MPYYLSDPGAPTQRNSRFACGISATDEQIYTLTTAPRLSIEDFASPASLNLNYDADEARQRGDGAWRSHVPGTKKGVVP